MKPIPFSYRTLQYVHDPVAGECINIGVLLYAPKMMFFDYSFEHHFRRLSLVFADFSGDTYKKQISSMEHRVNEIKLKISNGKYPVDVFESMESISRQILPDQGGCFRYESILGGLTSDPARELQRLFDRVVTSQGNHLGLMRRDDVKLWNVYSKALSDQLKIQIRQHVFKTHNVEQTFDRTIKNGKVHVLQPVSLDYRAKQDIQKRAVELLGIGTALKDVEELGSIYLLLGSPQDEAMLPAYLRARDLMAQIPVQHKIIEEDEIADFGNELENLLHSA